MLSCAVRRGELSYRLAYRIESSHQRDMLSKFTVSRQSIALPSGVPSANYKDLSWWFRRAELEMMSFFEYRQSLYVALNTGPDSAGRSLTATG